MGLANMMGPSKSEKYRDMFRWVISFPIVNNPPASWGALRGKERGEATPPCDSSPQQAAGYSRWNSINRVYNRQYCAVIRRKALTGPWIISVETHNRCNLRCSMCPYPSMKRGKTSMGMHLFRRIIDDAPKNGITHLSLRGYSEPLLDDSLFERIRYAKAKGLKVGFTSNGTLLTSHKARRIVESELDWITFSVDGATKEEYEDIRIGANFEEVVSNINGLLRIRQEARATKPVVSITSVAPHTKARQIRQVFKDADSISCGLADNSAGKHLHLSRAVLRLN